MGRRLLKGMGLMACVVVVLCLCGLMLLSSMYIVLRFSDRKKIENATNIVDYQYFQLNPTTNESSSGIITFPQFVEEKGFASFEEDNAHILISKFGLNEFQCTGSCYCEEDRRGSISVSLLNGLTYLVAAVSSVIAIGYAKKYFEEKCRNEISECDEHLIRSEVNSCIEIVYPYPEERDEYFDEYEEKTTIFLCKGNCLPNVYEQDEPWQILEDDLDFSGKFGMLILRDEDKHEAETFGCEKLEFETEVWIDPIHFDEESLTKAFFVSGEVRLQEAQRKFMYEYLEKFCFMHSYTDLGDSTCDQKDCENLYKDFYSEEYKKNCVPCESLEVVKRSQPLCVSHNNGLYDDNEDGSDENKSIVCREMREKTLRYREQVSKTVEG